MKIKSAINHKWMLIPSLTLGMGLVSCNKFLEEPLNKTTSTTINTAAQLNAILENYGVYGNDNNAAFRRTDDFGIDLTLYNARPGSFASIPDLLNAFWDVTELPNIANGDPFWNNAAGEWRDVFYANAVLLNVDKVEGNEDEKERIKADAHLDRAYAYWQLANTYCLPYTTANANEMGLPIKRSPNFEEDLHRTTLKETYAFIESDVQEALKIKKPLVVNGRAQHWRASTASAHGFAARFYLERGNYAEALKHAEASLAEYSTLVDYNNPAQMYYGPSTIVTVNGTIKDTLKFPYTHTNQTDLSDQFGWKEFLLYRVLVNSNWWYVPSRELLNLYDKANDRRYEYHIVEDYSYASPGNMNGTAASPTAYSYPGYVFFFKDRIPSGLTTAEMYLIKAECMARMNNVAGAMAAVNTLRAKRIKPGPEVNLTASTQEDAVKKIIDERRREMPFTARWFDIRRYNNNEVAYDDVVLTKTFYPMTISGAQLTQTPITQTLDKNSRRYALPLPQSDITASRGALQQNVY